MNAEKIRIKTIEAQNKNGDRFTIVETYDDNDVSPRRRNEYLSRFYTFERDNYSPDSSKYDFFSDWVDDNGFDVGESPEDLIESMAQKGYIALPVWRYEHSGVSYSAALQNPYSCHWDSGMVGIIYVSKDYSNTETKENIIESLKREVDEYTRFVNGELLLYEVYDEDNNLIDSVEECYINDSCNNNTSPEEAILNYLELLPL